MKTKLILGGFVISFYSGISQITQNSAGQTGFGNSNPSNRVEITSKSGDPYHGSTNGSSGLKLTNLSNTVTAGTANGKVLTTDASGNVILVNDQTGVGGGGGLTGAQNGCSTNGSLVEFGNAYPGTAASLLSNRQIPQGNFKLLFSGDATNDLFQIGGNNWNSGARLFVENRIFHGGNFAEAIGVRADADNTTKNIGYAGSVYDKSGSGNTANENIGINLEVSASKISTGAYIKSTGNANSTSLPTYGINLLATNTVVGNVSPVYGIHINALTSGGTNVNASRCRGIYSNADGGTISEGGAFTSTNSTSQGATLSIGVSGYAINNPIVCMGGNFSGGGNPNNTNPSATTRSYGVFANGAGSIENYGGKFEGRSSLGVSTATNYGIHSRGLGESGTTNYGVYSESKGINTNQSSMRNYAGYFEVGDNLNVGNTNYGIKTIAEAMNTNNNPSTNYGIWAEANGAVGSTWAGWFQGDVQITGNTDIGGAATCAAGFWSGSDKRFKKDILKLQGTTDLIKKISGYTYYFNQDEFKNKNFNDKQQIGFIAQELSEVFPQLVTEGKDGYLAVNYQGMIPVLLEAIKEQQQQIDELKQHNQEIQQRTASYKEVEDLNVLTGFQMSQNEPNPFTHETVIKYTLPQTVANAFMAVYDLTGKQITTFPIEQKGSSFVTINSQKLAAGIYIYSIVADGKVMDSKRMIVSEK